MKNFFLILVLLFTIVATAQEDSLENVVKELKQKIASTEKGEKLKWMDSLTLMIEFNEEFKYDSIIQENIRFAISIDSFNTATRHTADRIYYKSSILSLPQEGLEIFNNYKVSEESISDYSMISNLHLYAGDCYYALKNYDEALSSYENAKNNAVKSGVRSRMGLTYLRVGSVYMQIGKLAEASNEYQDANNLFLEVKDTLNIINTKNSLSVLYSQNGFYEEAEEVRKEAIELSKEIGGGHSLVSLYYNAAFDHNLQGNNQKWISNLKLALAESEISEYRAFSHPNILNNLVAAYAENDSIALAEKIFAEVESNPEAYTMGVNRDYYLMALKELAFAKGNYQDALKYGMEHLELTKAYDGLIELYSAEKFLGEVYQALGETDRMNHHLNAYYRVKDSVSNVQNVKSLAYYQTLYETEKRDRKIESQDKDITLLDAQNSLKNQLLIFGSLGLLGFFGLLLLFRSRNAAQKRQKLQEGFSQDLIIGQEEERTRVARELHDSVGQRLAIMVKKSDDQDNQDMKELATGTLGELRSIARGLHPSIMDRLGTTKAIETMVDELNTGSGTIFTNDIEDIDQLLNKEDSLHLYRIIQEVLTNMMKHANAKAASVTVEKGPKIIKAVIKDNGDGFSVDEKINKSASLGMKTLFERAKILKSQLKVDSEINKGTTVVLEIPI